MQIDEVSYLDQLHEAASAAKPTVDSERAKRRFLDIVFQLWPEISATFDEHKHSL